jgi:hypothetical protein
MLMQTLRLPTVMPGRFHQRKKRTPMKKKPNPVICFSLIPLVLLIILSLPRNGHANEERENLALKVRALDLGLKGYIIGSRLSETQKKTAAANPVEHAYSGTYKFSDGDLLIVASDGFDIVLAVYQHNDNATIEQTRGIITELMGKFGEPTTMIHDTLIYWAYNEQGKIPEESFSFFQDKVGEFTVLATIKFRSTLPVQEEDLKLYKTGTTYFMISSDPLLRDFSIK